MSVSQTAAQVAASSMSREASVDTHVEHGVFDEKRSEPASQPELADGQLESAIPEDKKEDPIVDAEDGWATDPRNPRNWPPRKKWTMTAIVSLYTFITPLASSMMAPALEDIGLYFHMTNQTVIAMTLSIFLVSYAIAPLFLAPISEMYGRTWVYHIGNLAFLAFNIGCVFSPTGGALIAFRFLSGIAGAAPIAVGGGSISDMFSERDRAVAMSLYSLGPLVGPAVGPIAGGFITQTVGFRYLFIVIVGLAGIGAAVGIPFLRETYSPVIRLRLARKCADPEAATKAHPHLVNDHGNKWKILSDNLVRPIILLTRSTICFMLSAYMALMYGIYYLMFATFPDLFSEVYGFDYGTGGLAYIGLGLGFVLSTVLSAKWGDMVYITQCKKNGDKGRPEFRIPALIFGSLFVPIGLFWYGWSAQARIHWIMPIIGSGIFGFGMMATFLPIQLYLVDTFTYAASALAAASVFRSMLGFAFPLFGSQMFAALGYGGGNSLLAGLAIVIGIPFPIFLYFYGEKIRMSGKYTR